jgi:hypothetical protein
LFDADGDKDADMYVVSGGNVYNPLTATYQDRLYFNDGKGNFTLGEEALPELYSSGSVVVANDFDKDGDQDLFVGGRIIPTRYPLTPESYILENNGSGLFRNATPAVSAAIKNIGMVIAALWSDFDKDGWTDLIIAGEWMPVTFFRNEHGVLKKLDSSPAIDSAKGWWFSLTAGDFDKDGDTDYIAGNLGHNNRYDVSEKTPVSVYAKDFDGNGSIEPMLTYYVDGKEVSIANRDQITSVMPSIKKKFDTYTKFSEADFATLFSKDELEDALVLKATTFTSVYIENKGGGKFTTRPLPVQAQFSAIQGMQVADFDHDTNLDVLIAGNFYSPDFMTGRYDASIGLLLKGDGRGNFTALTAAQSGIRINGDARCLGLLRLRNKPVVLAAVNAGRLQVFSTK